MPGYASLDDFIYKVTALGQFKRIDWNKNFLPTTAATAGEWHSLFRGGGNPGADAILNTGTNLAFQQLKDTTANATGIQHGGNVSPAYKHIINASAFSAAATTMPAVAVLVDLLGFYRVTSVTTTGDQATTNPLTALTTFTADAGTDVITHGNIGLEHLSKVQLTTTTTLPAGLSLATNYYVIKITDDTCKLASSYANAVAGTPIDITDAGTGTHTINTLLPRYTSGAGVMSFAVNSNATALGAATPNLRNTYTDQADNSGNITPSTLPACKTAAANGLILYSGTGAGKYGPFMPLAAGDSGIRSIEQINLSASYVSGEFAQVLCKPLLSLPMTTIGVAAERDLMHQVPSLPRIIDGACLTWLLYSGAATPTNSAFYGHIDVGWA
jgi:hypothetical protein